MTATKALEIAATYGCSIGRRKPGIYYVTKNAQDYTVRAKHLREVVAWIRQEFGA